MRLLLYFAILSITILGYNTQPAQAWGFAPIFIRWPIWSNCCWLWRLFGWCQQSGGQQNAAPTTPPIVCGAQTFLWNGQCLPSIQNCPTSPNSGIYASTSAPCSCSPPGSTLAGKTECIPPTNGNMYCETASNGASSKCLVKCDPGYTSTDGVTCIKGKLKASVDCNPGEVVAQTTVGGACSCTPYGAPNTPTLQACPNMVFNPNPPPGGVHGEMTCVPQTGQVAKCIQECDTGYNPAGQAACV